MLIVSGAIWCATAVAAGVAAQWPGTAGQLEVVPSRYFPMLCYVPFAVLYCVVLVLSRGCGCNGADAFDGRAVSDGGDVSV